MKNIIVLFIVFLAFQSCDVPRVDTKRVEEERKEKKVKHITGKKLDKMAMNKAVALLDSIYMEAESKFPKGILALNNHNLKKLKTYNEETSTQIEIKLLSQDDLKKAYKFEREQYNTLLKSIKNKESINKSLHKIQEGTLYYFSKPVISVDNHMLMWSIIISRSYLVNKY